MQARASLAEYWTESSSLKKLFKSSSLTFEVSEGGTSVYPRAKGPDESCGLWVLC